MSIPARIPESPQTRPTLEPSPFAPDQKSREAVKSSINRFSLVVGGPIYDLLLRLRVARQSLPNATRRIVTLTALTWLPLLLLSLKDGLAFGQRVRIPFLYDFSIYGVLLIGLPLLLLAEIVIDPPIRMALAEFVDARIVPDEELPAFENILQGVQRLRDSAIPELILLVLAFFPTFLFQHEWKAGAVSSWHTIARGLTAAGWWFAIFCTPLLRFITYRWVFRCFIWALLLWRISHLRLVLMPTHPDHAAGLNFLGMTEKHFGILFCAAGCFFAGRVANNMVFEGAPLTSFKIMMAAFVVMSLILALLPLAVLAPKLKNVRKMGLLEYGRLANRYSASFDRKWVHNIERPSESLLGSGDIQSLADLGSSFALVEAMKIAPISKRLVLQLGIQAALPLIPVIVFGTPIPELVHAVMKMVL